MKIKNYLVAVVGLISIQAAWGDDIHLTKISDAHSHILQLQQKYGAGAVLVISDVDGTLTSKSFPDDSPHAPAAIPRGTAVQMIQDIQQKGSPIVVSSAWDNFNGTTKRLTELNLSKNLQIPSDKKFSSRPYNIKVHGNEIPVEYYEAGNAISVKYRFQDSPYFFNKALAPYINIDIKKDIESEKIKKVVFLDDSERNHNDFAKDVKKYNLYPGASIDYIHLAPPSEDPDLTQQHSNSKNEAAASCSSTDASSPVNNLTKAMDNCAKVAHAVNHSPHSASKPTETTQGEMMIVTDREMAKRLIQKAAPGTEYYWHSASTPGAMGKYKKNEDGTIVGPTLIKP